MDSPSSKIFSIRFILLDTHSIQTLKIPAFTSCSPLALTQVYYILSPVLASDSIIEFYVLRNTEAVFIIIFCKARDMSSLHAWQLYIYL